MNELLVYLLVGFALGTTPAVALAGIFTAWLGQRLGVKPQQVEAYRNATALDETPDDGGN